MGGKTKIEWCDATFNPWWGCSPVSPACDNCYAAAFAKRMGVDCFGDSPRQIARDSYWAKPLAWNRRAEKEGRRISVFTGSMCDVFEERPMLSAARKRLFDLIEETVELDWLLLTKRPKAISSILYELYEPETVISDPPIRLPNVWLGVTAENQLQYDQRVPWITTLAKPGRAFVSIEPLLGPIELRFLHLIGGVIVGGETGPGARPMHPDWVRSIRDQCQAEAVPFFFKQWGEWAGGCVDMSTGEPMTRMFESYEHWANKASTWVNGGTCIDRRGGICSRGACFRDAEYPVAVMHRVGKKLAGRLLDGREWNELPWCQSFYGLSPLVPSLKVVNDFQNMMSCLKQAGGGK